MNSNSRAIALLDRLVKTAGLTPDGRDALIQLANPFTDFESRRVGFYDANQAASVVQCIKKSVVVTSPLATSDNWDCNIATLPLLGHQIAQNYPKANVVVGAGIMTEDINSAAALSSFGPVNILRGASGAALNFSTSVAATSVSGTALSLGAANTHDSNSFLDGHSRLIGMGFEVHNTTSELYKQGAVAVYHQPQNTLLDRSTRIPARVTGSFPAPTTMAFSSAIATHTVADIPSSLASCLLMSGTRQWDAADGCMCIPTLISAEIPTVRRESVAAAIVDHTTPIILTLSGSTFTAYPGCVKLPSFVSDIPAIAGVFSTVQSFTQKYTNFNTVGAYFSGLSSQTTLVVNAIYYVERFPSPDELNLVVMAQPGPPSDPVAAALYSILMREMPPGVKVADNADGDWFYDLVSGAASFLKPALMAAGPFGVAGSVLASGAETWANNKKLEGAKKVVVAPQANNQQKAIQARPKKAPNKQGSTWAKPAPKMTKKQKAQAHKAWTEKSGM